MSDTRTPSTAGKWTAAIFLALLVIGITSCVVWALSGSPSCEPWPQCINR